MNPRTIIKSRRNAEEVAKEIVETVKAMPQQQSFVVTLQWGEGFMNRPKATTMEFYKFDNLTDSLVVSWTHAAHIHNNGYMSEQELAEDLWNSRKAYNNYVRYVQKKEYENSIGNLNY